MKIPVLMYHMVSSDKSDKSNRYCCSPKRFRAQMAYLKRKGYVSITLDDIAGAASGRIELPGKSLVITFDDGYLDNYINAFPELLSCGYRATVFVVAGLAGKTSEWLEAGGTAAKPLMDWKQISALADCGISIGSHSMTHQRLSFIKSDAARLEIEKSKEFIEDKLGQAVDHFAYPYGCYDINTKQLTIDAKYSTACTTKSGFNGPQQDLFELRRLDIYGTDSLLQFATKVAFGSNRIDPGLVLRYYASRIAARFR